MNDETKLIDFVKRIGLGRVREILEKEYHSRDNLAKRFEKLMDINGKYSPKIYEDMVFAKSQNRRFVIPIFNPPHVPLITDLPFKIKNTDEWIKHLVGRDKVIWESYNLFLTGHIPVFDIHKGIDVLEVTRTQEGDKFVYDLVAPGYKGYNPLLNKGGLKKYYQICGHMMTCIVFDITYYDDNTYPDGVYDYGISQTLSSLSNSRPTLEYGDDGYETP